MTGNTAAWHAYMRRGKKKKATSFQRSTIAKNQLQSSGELSTQPQRYATPQSRTPNDRCTHRALTSRRLFDEIIQAGNHIVTTRGLAAREHDANPQVVPSLLQLDQAAGAGVAAAAAASTNRSCGRVRIIDLFFRHFAVKFDRGLAVQEPVGRTSVSLRHHSTKQAPTTQPDGRANSVVVVGGCKQPRRATPKQSN